MGESGSKAHGTARASPGSQGGVMSTRWKVNLIPVERVARVLVGLVAAVGGAYLLGGAGSTLAIAVEAIVIITGMDLVVTA